MEGEVGFSVHSGGNYLQGIPPGSSGTEATDVDKVETFLNEKNRSRPDSEIRPVMPRLPQALAPDAASPRSPSVPFPERVAGSTKKGAQTLKDATARQMLARLYQRVQREEEVTP